MRILVPCLLTALLAACHTGAPVAVKKAAASPRPSATVAAAASATPAPPAGGPLLKPAGATRELSGTVALEATYALGTTLVSDQGGGLRFGEAALIANNGGNIIANNGGSVLHDNGAGLISDNGGGLVSDQGGGIIANHGGGLVSDQGGGYRLLDAAPAPAFGTVLPAAGLTLGVEDLATGKLLTLGQDAAGHTTDAIVTNASGGFHVYLPADASSALRVVAVPPTGADARLRTAYLSSHLPPEVALDEDTVQVASFVRNTMATNFIRLSTRGADEAATDDSLLGSLDAAAAEGIKAGLNQVVEAYQRYRINQLPMDRQVALAARLSDVIIAHMDLEAMKPADLAAFAMLSPLPADETGSALVLYGKVIRQMRENISRVMAAKAAAGQDPGAYLEAKSYVQQAEQRDGVRYEFLKPGDLPDFLDRAVLSNPRLDGVDAPLQMAAIFADPDVGLKGLDVTRIFAAQVGIALATLEAAYIGPNAALPDVLATIEANAGP